MKQLLLTSTIIALSALPLSAQEVAKSGKFASIVKNIGNALNIGQVQRLQRRMRVHSLRSQQPLLLDQY